jgi:hypothetical protein
MPIVNKANGLLAEFAIFPVEPSSQASLVERAIQNIWIQTVLSLLFLEK